MKNQTKEELRQHHINSYRETVIEIIKNNTNSLVDTDIMSLIKKPPLDSMDLIQVKFLSLAKKNKIVLNTEELSKLIDNYRNSVLKCSDKLKKERINELSTKVNSIKFGKENDIIKINKKDFTTINKNIKKIFKEQVIESYEKEILSKMNVIFDKKVEESIVNKVTKEATDYLKKNYQRQLLENVDIKILVKDTTLINNVKEQTERYIFALNNSRLLNEID